LVERLKQILLTPNVLGSVFWFTALGFLGPATKIFLLPLYLKFLTPEDYGILSLVGVFTAIVAVFTVVLSLLLLGCLLATGPKIFEWLFVEEAVKFYPYGILAISTAFLSACTSIYFIYLKNKVLLKQYFLYSVASTFLVVLLQAYCIIQLQLGILGIFLGSLIPAMLIFLIIILTNRDLLVFRFKVDIILPSIKFALPLLPFSFLFVFEKQIDRLILERNMTLEEVGIYALLVGLLALINIALGALDNAIRPFLYQSLKDGGPTSFIKINQYFLIYLAVGFLSLSGIILVGCNLHWITDNLRFLKTQKYFTFGALAMIPLIYVRYVALLFVYNKKSFELTISTIFKTVMIVSLMLWLIPVYGIHGAIAATGISNLFNCFLFNFLIQSHPIPPIQNKLIIGLSFVFFLLIIIPNFYLASNHIGIYGIFQFLITLIYLFVFFKSPFLTLFKEKKVLI